MPPKPLRLLILGAHPDDAEFHAGGLASIYRRAGHRVRMVSVTDGGAGHHQLDSPTLVQRRREEAAEAAAVIGAEVDVWDDADGRLQPTLELRERLIREVRQFAPDLVLTHRPHDYHPDHRAVGQALQDASYMVTVPLVVPDIPPLRSDPVVAYMPDLFTRPTPLRADVAYDIGPELDTLVRMLACHRSQVFEFLPHSFRYHEPVPVNESETARLQWLQAWYQQVIAPRADRFRPALCRQYGQQRGTAVRWAEALEISEYARPLDEQLRRELFWFLEQPDA